jgi:hypothetical protein
VTQVTSLETTIDAEPVPDRQRPARLGGRAVAIGCAAVALVVAGLLGPAAIRLLMADMPAPVVVPANRISPATGPPLVSPPESVTAPRPALEAPAIDAAVAREPEASALPARLPAQLIQVNQPPLEARSESIQPRLEAAEPKPESPAGSAGSKPESVRPESASPESIQPKRDSVPPPLAEGTATPSTSSVPAAPLASATRLPSAPAPLGPVGARTETPAGGGDTRAIQMVISRYQTAFNDRNASIAKSVWPSLDERKLEKAFDQLDEQEITFNVCTFELSGAQAAAACQGQARYVRKVGSRTERVEPRRWEFKLTNTPQGWTIGTVQTW